MRDVVAVWNKVMNLDPQRAPSDEEGAKTSSERWLSAATAKQTATIAARPAPHAGFTGLSPHEPVLEARPARIGLEYPDARRLHIGDPESDPTGTA